MMHYNGLLLVPLQHFMPDWDEYEDTLTGRRFYFNRITKEKTWKPPRKAKTSLQEGIKRNQSHKSYASTFVLFCPFRP